MNYWLHRISHHAEVATPLLNKGYLSIGFSDCNIDGFVKESMSENGWEYFESCFDELWGYRPRSRHSLWRFIAEMKQGDLVLVPGSSNFSVYEIIEESAKTFSEFDLPEILDWHGNLVVIEVDGMLQSSAGEMLHIDLGFFRRVKPVAINIPQHEYADAALTTRMKIRQTNANINELAESIGKSMESFNNKKPISLYTNIMEVAADLVLNVIRTELNPEKFDDLISWYFQRIGATEVILPPKNERDTSGDADIVAVFEAIKTVFYVQAKFHTKETSNWALQQIESFREQNEAMDDGYSKISWVISSAEEFSTEARVHASEAKIQLFDGQQFAKMLLEAGISNLQKVV